MKITPALCSKRSLVRLIFAIASGLFAFFSVRYGLEIGGFEYYDPRLMRIFGWAFLISSAGLAFSIIGTLRPSTHRLRNVALVCSAVMFLFWLLTAMGE